jgi:hypothetical protein
MSEQMQCRVSALNGDHLVTQGRMVVQGVNPSTRKLFEMTGLAALLCTNGVGNASRAEH